MQQAEGKGFENNWSATKTDIFFQFLTHLYLCSEFLRASAWALVFPFVQAVSLKQYTQSKKKTDPSYVSKPPFTKREW